MARIIQLKLQNKNTQVYCGKSLFFQLASPQFWFSKHLIEALNLDAHMDALHPLVGWTANMAWPGPLSDGLQKHDPANSIDRICEVCWLGNSLKAPLASLANSKKCFESYTWNNKKGQKYAKVRRVQKRHLHWLNRCFLISSDHSNNWLMLFRQVRVCLKNMFVPAKLISLPQGGFLKWWHPTTIGFPTKNDHFGVFWGYHHLRNIHILATKRISTCFPKKCLGVCATATS